MLGMLAAVALLMVVMIWLLSGKRGPGHEPTIDRQVGDEIDRAELEQAEREVRDAPDEDSVQDWGPGAGKPRPPEML